MTDVRGRRRARARRAPGCAGGRRCCSPAAVYSCTRSCGTSSARPAATRARPSGTPTTSSTSSRRCTSTSSRRSSSGTSTCPANGLIRLWNVYYGIAHFLVTFIALVWMFRRDPRPPPAAAQHARAHHRPRGDRLRRLLPHAAPPARRPGRVRRLPDLRPGGGRAPPSPARSPRPAATSTASSTPSPTYGGWISFGNEGMKDVSNQYAAMPSMHIGWATWTAIVLFPLVRRRWAQGARRRLPGAHAGRASWSPPTTTGSTASAACCASGSATRSARAITRRPVERRRDARLTSVAHAGGSTRPGGRGSRPWPATGSSPPGQVVSRSSARSPPAPCAARRAARRRWPGLPPTRPRPEPLPRRGATGTGARSSGRRRWPRPGRRSASRAATQLGRVGPLDSGRHRRATSMAASRRANRSSWSGHT